PPSTAWFGVAERRIKSTAARISIGRSARTRGKPKGASQAEIEQWFNVTHLMIEPKHSYRNMEPLPSNGLQPRQPRQYWRLIYRARREMQSCCFLPENQEG